METKALNSHVVRQLAGMICSFTLGMTGIVGGIVCILKGFSPEGLASMFGSISVLAGVFVYGTYSNRKNSLDKKDAEDS